MSLTCESLGMAEIPGEQVRQIFESFSQEGQISKVECQCILVEILKQQQAEEGPGEEFVYLDA